MRMIKIGSITLGCLLALLFPQLLRAETVGYQYDILNRLVRTAYSDGRSIVYTYDAAGNITGTIVSGAPNPSITHSVTPSAGSHGAISPSTVQVVADQAAAVFIVTAEAGYTATVGGSCGGSLSGATFTTAPATADCTVEASFAADDQSPLNDTGITTCSNATQNGLTCPVTDFPGQDGEHGSNGFALTKLDANGNPLPADATNHTCVRDDVTGLVWEVKTDDNGARDKDAVYTLFQATELPGYAVYDGICGFHDWRLPTIKELQGIVDYSRASPGPTIDTAYFPETSGSPYWSSTLSQGSTSYAWTLQFQEGTPAVLGTGVDLRVRLVRGEELTPALRDNGDGTVTDDSTGLMWAKCAEGQGGTDCATGSATTMTWSDALYAADRSTLAEHGDWRLPNIQELITLLDLSRSTPSIDTDYFPNAPYRSFWSSTPCASFQYKSWTAGFQDGSAGCFDRSDTLEIRTRLVRNANASSDVSDQDQDNDGVPDTSDNCPSQPNADQANHDADANGDVCDSDDDNDGTLDVLDAFPFDPNEQLDTDGDGTGDNADTDDDGDGIADGVDNCPLLTNPTQADDDRDGIGDACDPTRLCWACLPNASGWRSILPNLLDQDHDGVPDVRDNCPTVVNADQANHDTDANGDACDTDDDNDGVLDTQDAFPLDPDEQLDTDGDGTGDNADTDDDGDGVNDTDDNCPLISNADQADKNGNGVGDACDLCWECLPNAGGWRAILVR